MPHSYENYEATSEFYTNVRKPVGLENHLNHFSGSKVALKDQILLDGGCGTGNYAVAFANKFKEICCFDYSEGMLEKAKENLRKSFDGKIPAHIKFYSGNILHLECFHDNTFDSICVNQVLHHLRPGNDFEDLQMAVKELYRVLKPGGRLVINFCPYESKRRAIFWSELVPQASEKWFTRGFTQTGLENAAKQAGFTQISCEPLLEENLFENWIYHPINFIENLQQVLSADSIFAMATEDEIKRAVERVKLMRDENTLDDWFKEKEIERKSIGQTVNLYGVKT